MLEKVIDKNLNDVISVNTNSISDCSQSISIQNQEVLGNNLKKFLNKNEIVSDSYVFSNSSLSDSANNVFKY